MNKKDLILIIIILSIVGGWFLFNSLRVEEANRALVYYQNELVKVIDLTISETKEYIIEGYLGDVILEAKTGKVRVNAEKSPLHLCSKQGFINKAHQVIVCLPNRVVIKIENKDYSLDTVIR